MRAIVDLIGEETEDELLEAMIKLIDSSKDGQIKWEEFYLKVRGRVNLINH